MRAKTQNVQQEGSRDMRRSVEGRGMLLCTQGKQDGQYRDFQEGKQEI